jgi:hypothetical protein
MTNKTTNGKLQTGTSNNPEKMKEMSNRKKEVIKMKDQKGNLIKCIKCSSRKLYFYDGALGYESIKCKNCGHDQNDPADPVRVEFLYRDADNYKTTFFRSVEKEKTETLEIGQMIEMGEYNTSKQNLFFDSAEHPFPYQHEYDHNLLEVTAINSIGFESEEYCSECDCVFQTKRIISNCPECNKRVIACNACRNCGVKCQICTDASMFTI